MPVFDRATYAFGGLTVGGVEVIALLGICLGWLLFDRLAAMDLAIPGRVALLGVGAAGGWVAWQALVVFGHEVTHGPGTVWALALIVGGLIRGTTDKCRSFASLVVIGAATSWLTYDLWRVPILPLRDLHLYLAAGAAALKGISPYLSAPLTSIPPPEQLPFVYPPFTLPLFALLASLPRPIVELVWVAASIAAVGGAFWLIGVRGRWLLVLMAWPITLQGIAVGNVASFGFFLYALGFQVGTALVLSGMFKIQSLIPSLWLIRERRWRQLIVGVAIIGVLALASVPIVGLSTWAAWPPGLVAFEETLARFPALASSALVRDSGQSGPWS